MNDSQLDHCYKLIIALKFQNDQTELLNAQLHCQISINDKTRKSPIPFQEGQFFDLSALQIGSVVEIIIFDRNNLKLGSLEIIIPESIIFQEETELANHFQLNYDNHYLKGSYYLIVLNKKFLSQKNQGPHLDLKQFSVNNKKTVQFAEVNVLKKTQTFSKGKQKDPLIKRNKTQQSANENQKPSISPSISKNSLKQKKEDERKNKLKEKINEITDKNMMLLKQYHQQECKKEMESLDSNECNPSISPMRIRRNSTDQLTDVTPVKIQRTFSEKIKNNVTPISTTDQKSTDQLKQMIYLLDQRNEKQKSNERINNHLLEQSDLQQLLFDALNNNENQLEDFKKQTQTIVSEKQSLEKIISEKNNQIILQLEKISQQDINLKTQQTLLNEQQKKIETLEFFQQKILAMENQLNLYEQINEESKLSQIKYLKEKESIFQELEQKVFHINNLPKQNEILNNERLQLKLQLDEIKHQLRQSENQLEQRDMLIQQLSRQMKTTNDSYQLQIKTLMDESQIHLKQIADLKYQNQGLVQALDQLKQQISKQAQKRLDDDKNQSESYEQVQKKLMEREIEMQTLNQVITTLNLQNQQVPIQYLIYKFKSQLANSFQLRELNREFQNESKTLKKKNQIIIDANDKLNEQLEEFQLQLQIMNEKDYEKSCHLMNIEALLQQKEIENHHLRNQLILMREKGIGYIPDQNDIIDKRLAEFINQQSEINQLKIIFVRISEGVYQFGTKKVYLKIEQDKLFVRIGGGFIKIEDFIEQYQQLELEKIEKNDSHLLLQKRMNTDSGSKLHKKERSNKSLLGVKNI